ncbi:hypothetical protein RHS01_07245 [Rhizoctonia solani]|uniref:UBX domain-containing protein n=1 Tax=Rhizoctonia solani TaxID=456999 RepID=A0A8H7I904_9AGAM|nr:hypothetical protein RHS01_07245 [Rhizoctonia solani]
MDTVRRGAPGVTLDVSDAGRKDRGTQTRRRLAIGRVPAAKEWVIHRWAREGRASVRDREVRAEEMFVTAGSKGGCEGKWSWGDVIKSACSEAISPKSRQYPICAPKDQLPITYDFWEHLTSGGLPSFPPKPATPFSRSGNRLGPSLSGEAPGSGSGSGSTSMPGVFANSEPEGIRTMFEVDNSQPTTSIQVRLADGTRLACRTNVTRTASDIRSCINAPIANGEAAGIKGSVVVSVGCEKTVEKKVDVGYMN